MTRSEWLSCDDPLVMLDFLRGKSDGRHVRLFVAAYVRRAFSFLTREDAAAAYVAVEAAERFAVGSADWAEVEVARTLLPVATAAYLAM